MKLKLFTLISSLLVLSTPSFAQTQSCTATYTCDGRLTQGSADRPMNGVARGLRVTLSGDPTPGFRIWARLSDSATGDGFKAAVVNASDHDTVLAESAERTDISTAGWYMFSGADFDTVNLANGATIEIVIVSNSAANALFNQDDIGLLGVVSSTLTYGPPFDLIDPLADDTTRDYSIYIEYQTGGAAGGNCNMGMLGMSRCENFIN